MKQAMPGGGDLRAVIAGLKGTLAALFVFTAFMNFLVLTTSLYMMQVADRVLGSHNLDTLYFLSLAAVIAVLAQSVVDGARSWVLSRVATHLDAQLSGQVFQEALVGRLGANSYDGEALRDFSALRSFIGSTSLTVMMDAPWAPFFIFAAYALHPLVGHLTLAAIMVLVVLALLGNHFTGQPLVIASSSVSRAQRWADLSIRNAEVVDALGMQAAVTRLYAERSAQGVALQQQATDRISAISSVSKFIRLAVQIAILGVGAYLVLNREMTSGGMIAGSIILGRALGPIEAAIANWRSINGARQAYRRLAELLSSAKARMPATALPPPQGELRVDRLIARAPRSERMILKAVSFAIPAGDCVAVIGPSGAGKTTLARLLVGTTRPEGGVVRLDGVDLSGWSRADVGRFLGYVPQDVELFPGTVAANIGRLEDMPAEEVVRAAKAAGCHEMILRLPQGYDTYIGDEAELLSAGQRQLLALARALVGNPRFIVLDEPNANLDSDGDAALNNALVCLKAARVTVVIISHRSSILQHVDRILLLRDGQVEAFGPRAEILNRLMAQTGTSGPREAVSPAA